MEFPIQIIHATDTSGTHFCYLLKGQPQQGKHATGSSSSTSHHVIPPPTSFVLLLPPSSLRLRPLQPHPWPRRCPRCLIAPLPLSSSSMSSGHCPPPFDSPQTLTWNLLPPLAPPLAQTLNGVDIQQTISERLNLPWNEAGVVEKWAYQTFTISTT
jgi:hypothetical protein